MLNTYKVIFNKNGTSLEIKAHGFSISDNILSFYVLTEIYIDVACFNLDNIIGFYKVRQ